MHIKNCRVGVRITYLVCLNHFINRNDDKRRIICLMTMDKKYVYITKNIFLQLLLVCSDQETAFAKPGNYLTKCVVPTL